MKTYFVSDAHLGLDRREVEKVKERELIRFLEMVELDGKRLFILGDLFDFWFEYRTVIPKGYHRLLAKLSQLVEKGIEVNYLAGNHDFWLGEFFNSELGVRVFLEPFAVTIDGMKFFLHHGDGLAEKDFGYRILKKILRNRLSVWLYSRLHPDTGVRLAHFLSRKSRNHSSRRSYREVDEMKKFAEQKMAEGFDYIVMGHDHKPKQERIGTGTYVNLGDWISHFTYGVFDGKGLRLEKWNRSSGK